VPFKIIYLVQNHISPRIAVATRALLKSLIGELRYDGFTDPNGLRKNDCFKSTAKVPS
jgi:hypothetical protein